MKALQEVKELIASEQGRYDLLPVPLPFVRLMGSPEGGLFVAQLLAWHDAEGGGWLTRSAGEWEAATTLSPYRVRALARDCQARGFLDVKPGPPGAKRSVRRYRLFRGPLLRALWSYLRGEPAPTRRRRAARRIVRLPAHADPAALPPKPPHTPHRQPTPMTTPDVPVPGEDDGPARRFGRQQWEEALAEVSRQMPAPLFERWLADADFVAVEGETVIVAVPTSNAAWWLNTRLSTVLTRAVNLVTEGEAWLQVEARPSL